MPKQCVPQLRLGGSYFFGLENLLVAIVAAILANVVAQLHVLATRASHDAGCADLPVSATAVLARL